FGDHVVSCLFFFVVPPAPAIYPLSLHDALPICHGHRGLARGRRDRARRPAAAGCDRPQRAVSRHAAGWALRADTGFSPAALLSRDRKSTRLNSSHVSISYAVFCLKKKKENT